MTDEKQNNPKGKPLASYGASPKGSPLASYGASKKINHDVLKWVIIGLAGFVVIILIFSAGIFIGGMKAKFSYRWAENYNKNFAGPRGGFLSDWREGPFSPGDFIEGHGAFGEIIEINPSTSSGTSSGQAGFVIKGRDNVEKLIKIREDTVIKKIRKTIKKDELKIGDRVVIVGSPNEEGQIEAKLIRIFDGEKKSKGHFLFRLFNFK